MMAGKPKPASPWAGPRRPQSVRLASAPRCPGCGEILDEGMEINGSGVEPRPGDWSVCAYCSAVLVFVGDSGALGLRFAAGDELILALADPKVRQARRVTLATGVRLPDQSK